ncbi:MAG: DUF2029 domain-containing protein [Chloroflexi bacterium]|nr:DUF2029 domain-containing protein [Chloroflexota bacterium]
MKKRLPPLRLLALSLWVTVFFVLVPMYLYLCLLDPLDYTRGGLGGADFKSYYVASRLLLENADIYDEQNQARVIASLGLVNDFSYYIYPPLLAISILPLALLPVELAAGIWSLLNYVFLILCIVVLVRVFHLDRRFGEFLPLAIIGGMLFAPVIYSMRMGQINILLLCLIVIAFAFSESGHECIAGLVLALASMLKVMPVALLIYLVWRGRFRLGLAGAAGICGLAVFNMVFLALWQRDVALDWRYVSQVLPSLTAPDSNLMNQSLNAFLTRHLAGQAGPVGPILNSLIAGTGIVLTIILASRLPQTRDSGLGMALVLVTALIVMGKTMLPTYALLLFPYTVMASATVGLRWRTLGIFGVVLSYAFIEATIFMPRVSTEIAEWIIGLPFLGALMVWVVIAALIMQSARRARNELNV